MKTSETRPWPVTFEETVAFFNDAELFSTIPKLYQDQIINFFLTNDWSLLNPDDFYDFLCEGEEIIIFTDLEELVSFTKTKENLIKGMTIYYGEAKSLEDWSGYWEPLGRLVDDDVLIRFFLSYTDEPSEETDTRWVMLSCIKEVG